MELIGRKAGDLSANCPARDVHSAGIRQLIYARPPGRSSVGGPADRRTGRDHEVEG